MSTETPTITLTQKVIDVIRDAQVSQLEAGSALDAARAILRVCGDLPLVPSPVPDRDVSVQTES